MQPITFFHNRQAISLNGTESNFREAIAQIYPSASNHDSDAYESDEDFSEAQKDIEFYIWRGNDSPAASRTTISCMDGKLKGNELLTRCRMYVKDFLECFEINEEERMKLPGRYFAACAGRFAKFKTSLDRSQPFKPGDYEFGISRVKTRLSEEERLFITDEGLKEWITGDLELKIERWDLPYRGYTRNDGKQIVGIDDVLREIKKRIFSYTAPESRKIPDNELGTAQLYCAFPKSYPIAHPYEELLEQGALHKFLDYFNALIFGVEASRNNLVFLTGVIVLVSMRYGSFPNADGTQSGSALYDDLLDIFPMSVTGTGSGNFVAEKAMYLATRILEGNRGNLEGQRALGFSTFRENPKWLKVTLKSAILVYNWLSGIIEIASTLPIGSKKISSPIDETEDSSVIPTDTSVKQTQNEDNSYIEETPKYTPTFLDCLYEELSEILEHHYGRK